MVTSRDRWAGRTSSLVARVVAVLLGPPPTVPAAGTAYQVTRRGRREVRYPATLASVRTLCGLAVAAGGLTGMSALLPSPPGFRVMAGLVIGGVTTLLGVTLCRLPWGRLRPRWDLTLPCTTRRASRPPARRWRPSRT